MFDVWGGEILLPDGNSVKEIGFSSPNVTSSLALPTTTLRFLSTVDTAKIPLYLAAGPSLNVWTTSESTEAWFQSTLLSRPAIGITEKSGEANTFAWWHLARSQSPIGILVSVQNEDNEESQKPMVTEILFYGTIAAPTTAGILTPPSSSPHLNTGIVQHPPELQVHALPLSSHLLHHQDADPPANGEAQFLPPRPELQPTPTSPRRKRDLFEEATIANKKARGRGGKGVAAAAARAGEFQQSYDQLKPLSMDTKAVSIQNLRPASANNILSRPSARPLSRSPSISSETRPLSRKGMPDAQSKRSNLSQVAASSHQPEEPTTESRNKEALSKVVMAAMRMHGLQQRKKNKRDRTSGAPTPEESQQLNEAVLAEEVAKDDEYKLIYHQTFKGAVLALRKHMSEKPLHAQSDLLRDIVEKLLAIFLTDPLTIPLSSNASLDPLATPGKSLAAATPASKHSHASPFDLPSSTRPGPVKSTVRSQIFTGSPVNRRKLDAS